MPNVSLVARREISGKSVTLTIDSAAYDEYSPTGILFYEAVKEVRYGREEQEEQ